MIPRISVNKPVNTDLDSGSARQVFQGVDPSVVDLCLFDDHLKNVSHRRHRVKRKRRSILKAEQSV